MLANSSGVDEREVQEKKKKVAALCSHPPQNVRLGTFTSSCKEEESKGK